MAKPVKERVNRWREKKVQKGGRSLSVWLEPETAKMMDHLLDYYGETVSPLITRGIKTLYEVTCNDENFRALREKEQEEEEKTATYEEYKEVEIDPLLEEIRGKLDEGIPLRDLKKILLDWIKTMKSQKVSFKTMADTLNAARIPTLAGKGKWQEGAVETILILNYYY